MKRGRALLFMLGAAVLVTTLGCSAPEEQQTDPRGTPPSGKSERELIREALDQDVAIPDAGVDVKVREEPE